MRTGLSQQTGLRQELRINPRLYQAMDMLYMPMMDLQQHLKQELLVNPFLELVEPEDEEVPTDATTEQDKERTRPSAMTRWIGKRFCSMVSTSAGRASSSKPRNTWNRSAWKPKTSGIICGNSSRSWI